MTSEHATDETRREAEVTPLTRKQVSVLVVAVLVAGLCSIVYELLIGTTSSYFLGDSVQQFSLTIGLFMAAMGFGSFLSRRIRGQVMTGFVVAEVALGVAGGVSVPLLYFVYAYTELYEPMMIVSIVLVGTLTGLEIPMLVLALRRHFSLQENLSNILSLDYLGALGATLLFPFVLLPTLGVFRSGLLTGLINLAMAAVVLRTFGGDVSRSLRRNLRFAIAAGVAFLALGFVTADLMLVPWHGAVYEDRTVFVQETPYQKIVLTRGREDVRMFLNGNLQFSSIDEYRYHEALVHPVMSLAPAPRTVLLLGGGDGLAVREILKHDEVEAVTVVDLDPAITELAQTHPLITGLNGDSLGDPRVTIHNSDAFVFLDENEALFDVIIIDLPDPNNPSLARLYSQEFYGHVERRLARGGVMVTQATSPFFAKEAFWCIEATVESGELRAVPYHVHVPSFGDWGFILAARYTLEPGSVHVEVPTRFLDDATAATMFNFGRDIERPQSTPSTLDEPVVLSHYLAGWRHWN